jgi:hypothetical protein
VGVWGNVIMPRHPQISEAILCRWPVGCCRLRRHRPRLNRPGCRDPA